ncbi:MAG: hypothetical protein JJE13_09770 [Thermoleophilia bacterium]|nr:hypothetical protein [Thermoleophilia bacterium]
MRDWPPITEPELLARLAMDRDEFFTFAREFSDAWGHREYESAYFERALGYPWERPAGSYLLREGQVSVLGDMGPAQREAAVEVPYQLGRLDDAVFEDMAAVIGRASETLWPYSEHLQAPWTPFPSAAG